jgi:hypothetical protein
VKAWRLKEGPDKEVFFTQQVKPGETLAVDWTDMKPLAISVQGKAVFELGVGAAGVRRIGVVAALGPQGGARPPRPRAAQAADRYEKKIFHPPLVARTNLQIDNPHEMNTMKPKTSPLNPTVLPTSAVSRRNFIKTSALSAGALVFLSKGNRIGDWGWG